MPSALQKLCKGKKLFEFLKDIFLIETECFITFYIQEHLRLSCSYGYMARYAVIFIK